VVSNADPVPAAPAKLKNEIDENRVRKFSLTFKDIPSKIFFLQNEEIKDICLA
jgi:hypothetical protein